MICPDCGKDLIDPPVYCKCGRDFRRKDSRTQLMLGDRPMTFGERIFAPWKIRKKYRWIDKDGVIRKDRNWFLGLWSILTILGFGLAYLKNPNIFGLAKSGLPFKLFILFILISFLLLARDSLSTRARDKVIANVIAEKKDKDDLKEMLDYQYRLWLDTPNPALNGDNPKEAVKSQQGIIKVQELLQELESSHKEEYDISWIRNELGISK